MDNIKPVASRGGGKKGKSSANFPPVTVEYKNEDMDMIPEDLKQPINSFISSTCTESQLAVTKSILDSLRQLENNLQDDVIKFLVLVLFESEPKHPVKCLLMRQANQMKNIHGIFMKHLSQIILSYQLYSIDHIVYPEYAKFILRLSSCFENFPLCVDTVKNIVSNVFKILSDCLLCCENKLSQCVSTTEKLEVSKLLHQTLHLYLNVYQKATLNQNLVNEQKMNMSNVMPKLVFRDDVSMDTKSLCAVIQITMMKSEGRDPWATGYPMATIEAYQAYWKKEESVLLCFYYALVTAAPRDLARRLDFASSKDVAQHILTLIKNIVDITDRLSGSVSVSLCGARGLAAAADWLNAAGQKRKKIDESYLDNDSDSNKEQYLSDTAQYESAKNKSELNESESKSDTDESDSNKPQPDLDILDPWLLPSNVHEYGVGEVYMGRTLAVGRLLAGFAERRLRHHAPAVRHLAEQIQANVMLYCLRFHPEEVKGWLTIEGGCGPGQVALLRRVATAGAGAGGDALRRVVEPRDLLPQLDNDHKQPHVAALLETYIEKDCSELESDIVFARWFPPILAVVGRARPLSAVVTDVLIKLLATAIDVQDTLLDFVLPLIENPYAARPANLKCTLFLMNVISKSKASKKYQDVDGKWKGLIGYDVLVAAILDDDDQIARLCTSVVWHGDVRGCARVVLALLHDAAHCPRALHADTRRALTHFLKRLEKEYRSSGSEKEIYVEMLKMLRSVCFSNLVSGANHYRRGIALFTLAAIAGMQLQECEREWSLEEVETVLRHLDDSYEANKQMALDILKACPQTLLREAVLSNKLGSIESLLERVSCRVRDAEAAAYKLELLVNSLPDIVLQHLHPAGDQRVEIESVRYAACVAALEASHAPPYRAAALTLLRTQLERLPLINDAGRGTVPCAWRSLARRAIERALVALEGAAPLVEAPSPEGLVPPVFFDIVVRPHHSEPHLYMVGEEVMTSQTMLLYAWTCAKEAWLIAALATQLVELDALSAWWRVLAACVARARHRAVHDHATKAYTAILRRLVKVGGEQAVSEVGALAAAWVDEADGTRRAAGLAGLVLAVAAVHPHMRYLPLDTLTQIHQTGAHHAAMALLRSRETARAAHDVLPCFVRRALHDADSPDAALQWACVGVVGAGVRRIAGAHAPGEGEGGVAPGERGRLRTTVFMSRYPGLYPYILECLERGGGAEQPIRASVACSLLLLSRLLPDDASTTTTCPSTSTLHDGVLAACGSASYHTRRLAAAAATASLPSAMYVEHASAVLKTLSNKHTAKNLCHGLVLRLLAMIHEAPELPWAPVFALGLPPTLWIVDSPCFLLVHEYLNLIIVLVNRYPVSLEAEYRIALGLGCRRAALGRVLPGAQLCAARALGVAAAMLDPAQAARLISDGLNSNVHEVCLASLDCLASAQGESGSVLPISPTVWAALGADKPALLARLARIMQTHVHIECRRQSLRVLVLEGAYGCIFGEEYQPGDDDDDDGDGDGDTCIVEKLCWYMRACDTASVNPGGAPPCPGAQALYARALGTHLQVMQVKDKLQVRSRRLRKCIERVSECVWSWSAAQGARGTRDAARELLRDHGTYLMSHDDDSLRISLLVGAAAARLDEGGRPGPGLATSPALLLALALLDFGLTEQTLDDQYQSSDNEIDSELYEEGIWTDRCTDTLIKKYAQTNPGQYIIPYIWSLINQYKTLEQVCGSHFNNFVKLLKNESDISDVHDKVELLVSKLKAFDASIQS